MKPEYDFSQAEKGKFYNPKGKFNLPIYLESDVHDFIMKLAEEKDIDISVLVNQWLRNNINLVKTINK